MSHNQERKEKNCLNCNSIVFGRYCHVCGQENIEPKESFWHLVKHFFEDFTHFDGKFFVTMKDLLFKPGFLSIEYLKGKRVTYLHPVRMYIFTSAIFFLVYFSFYHNLEHDRDRATISAAAEAKKLLNERDGLIQLMKDSLIANKLKEPMSNKIAEINKKLISLKVDTSQAHNGNRVQVSFGNTKINSIEGIDGIEKFNSVHEYDSCQKLLPPNQRDGFFERKINEQGIYLKEKYKDDEQTLFENLIKQLVHRFPQVLFISLPLFALFLRLIYIRRKNFYYVSHVICSIHLYCAIFILILLNLWTESLVNYIFAGRSSWVNWMFLIAELFYGYRVLSVFYGQSTGKTILKYSLSLIFLLFVMISLFLFLLIFSVFSI